MADKKKALETALAQIEKAYGKGTIMRLGQNDGMNVEAISTGSIALDAATGIGGALVEALHAKAKELGAERMMLEVRVSNAAAIALYKKQGYEKIAVRKGYYGNGEDADIMQKKL